MAVNMEGRQGGIELSCPHLPKTESPKAQARVKPLVLGEGGLEEKPQSGRGREAQTSELRRGHSALLCQEEGQGWEVNI